MSTLSRGNETGSRLAPEEPGPYRPVVRSLFRPVRRGEGLPTASPLPGTRLFEWHWSNQWLTSVTTAKCKMSRLAYNLGCLFLGWSLAFGQASPDSADQEWKVYGHDPGAMRFSELKQIDRASVSHLGRAWTYVVAGGSDTEIEAFETTPLMVDGVLYFTTPRGRAIAVDGDSGKELWVFDPFAGQSGSRRPIPSRGAAYWEGHSAVTCGGERNSADRRIFYATLDGRLFALDPRSGKPCVGFRCRRGYRPAKGSHGRLATGKV